MTLYPMNPPNPTLSAYMAYSAEDTLHLFRFVEHGGRLISHEDAASLTHGLADLRHRIAILRTVHPRLGRQLEFLVNFFSFGALHPSVNVRASLEAVLNETAFALLYASREEALPTRNLPGAGAPDEAAVVETVLTRHTALFERHCAAHGLDWESLQPEAVA